MGDYQKPRAYPWASTKPEVRKAKNDQTRLLRRNTVFQTLKKSRAFISEIAVDFQQRPLNAKTSQISDLALASGTEYKTAMTPLPPRIADAQYTVYLEAYAAENQLELWESILSDRTNPDRKGIWPGIDTFTALKAYMGSCNQTNPLSEEFGYLIRNESHQLVGTLHIFSVDWPNKTVEMGYGLHHAQVGKGFAARALRCAEDMLQKIGFERVVITCQQWNQKSWAVAERSGYELQRRFHKGMECRGCDDCTRVYQKLLLKIVAPATASLITQHSAL